MNLSPGTRIGSCEILSLLGAGGMGEVYRARDTRLERIVAIKSLARGFSGDAERLARFEREAKLLAALNHANIAAIYGLEESNGAPYLVLEFVDGETLATRIARGALSVSDTMALGGQIAAAMEAAHQKGIVHRDLKPGNVMVTAQGAAKVLDFGLARGAAPVSSPGGDLSASPTMALSSTRDGLILGTAPYMSPEQARGRPVDDRTDVWAFGCVLFECLTGRVTFGADTVPDAIARILEREPDWKALPAGIPQKMFDLMKRCLTKDLELRPRSGEVRAELAAVAAEVSSGSAIMARPGAEKPSLAVLYFENLSSDADSDYFCAGITEDILTDLSKIKKLRVASRNAVVRYRGKSVDPAEVGRELGVGAVLEGSVRRAGDRVRISAQLINAVDGFHLWAERYDRTLEDVFAVQEEIASAIAEALRITLTPAEVENLVQNRPKEARAYDLYLKGREQYSRYSKESLNAALALFHEAVEVDPNYALAWAGIADAHSQLFQHGLASDTGDTLRRAREAAERGVALNPGLGETHKALALVCRSLNDFEGERAALLRAIEANPRFTGAIINMAVSSYGAGDVAGSERFLRRALDIDPQEVFAMIWMAFLMMETGRTDEALGFADRVRSLTDSRFYVTGVYELRAMIALSRGDRAGAARLIREGVADNADPENLRAVEALIALEAEDTETVRSIVRDLGKVQQLGMGAIQSIAAAAIGIGDFDGATGFMTRTLVKDLSAVSLRMNPKLHPLLHREPFVHDKADLTLIWPLEAPMIDAARFHVFKEVKIESALPSASQIVSG